MSSTSTALALSFNLGTVDNNGNAITRFELESDSGLGTSVFTKVESYPGSGSYEHTLTFATDGISEGKIYTFRWFAVNIVGSSQTSKVI